MEVELFSIKKISRDMHKIKQQMKGFVNLVISNCSVIDVEGIFTPLQ